MGWPVSDEHALEYRLGFDGRVHYLEHGHWLKFEIKRGSPMPERPHGLRYSFSLHTPNGKRLVGFDNAHGVAPIGGRYRSRNEEHDHWHRHGDDPGQPYRFTTAEQLLLTSNAKSEASWLNAGLATRRLTTAKQRKEGRDENSKHG